MTHSHRHHGYWLIVVIQLQAMLPLVAQIDLSAIRPPLFNPPQISAGAFGNALGWGYQIEHPSDAVIVSEFYFSRNQVAGDGDDLKIFETRWTNDVPIGGASRQSLWQQSTIPSFDTNLFIPSNLGGYYFLYQRLSFEDTGIVDADPGNNVIFSLDQIYVRPQPGDGMNYSPASLPNQRLMFVNTASTLGEPGIGNSLATILDGTYSMPYRSPDFPAETGTVTYVKLAGSSAQMTVTTTGGGLVGLQRIVNMTYDSSNTGTYAFTATYWGFPADNGSGFFYEVTPITNHVSLGTAYVTVPNVLASNAVVLRWSGGAPPFTLESKPDCTPSAQWQIVQLGEPEKPATNLVIQTFVLSPTNQTGFYRIRGQ